MILAFFLLLLLSPVTLPESPRPYMIIWNVGQGAWTTVLVSDECWHFDAGGEYFPKAVERLCRAKQNRLFISHDDWDHIGFIPRITSWPRICLYQPTRQVFSPRKQKLFDQLSSCNSALQVQKSSVQEVEDAVHGKKSNDLSRVYYLPMAKAIFPGDSTAFEEQWWAQNTKNLKINWWLLGHHGSQSSNSQKLIDHLHQPWAAISSARYKRYRHPHPLIQARLKQNKIPLLRTEEWGHLWIQI